MSPTSADAIAALTFGYLPPVTEKLTKGNHNMWLAQVTATLQGAHLAGYIKADAKPPAKFLEADAAATAAGKKDPVPNPDHEEWIAKDSQVRGYLFSSLSKEIFSQVASSTTSAKLWAAIHGLQASQSRTRVIATRMALATATKGSSTVAEYFTKMKGLADEMASAGRKLDDEELVSYILTGLGEDFESVVTAVSVRVEPITVQELYAQMVSHEQCKELRDGGSQSSVNSAERGGRGGGRSSNSRGGRGNGGRGGSGRGRNGSRNGGCGGGHNNNYFGHNNNYFQAGVLCQICKREGHGADRCYKYIGYPQKSASAATTASYGVDTNWYVDSGATDHITSELDKLSIRDKYQGEDQVHTASGSGMKINHVGHSILRSQHHDLHLKNILHVPCANKSLLSVNRLAQDNNAFLEFHPHHFLIKEQDTKKIIFRGPCEGGLYPLKYQSNKEVHAVSRPTASLWHHRLGCTHHIKLSNMSSAVTKFIVLVI